MIISVVNKKGGTGKTTTVVNLGKGLTMKGYNVLLIDLDPQGNLSFSVGVKTMEDCPLGDAMDESAVSIDHIYTGNEMDIIPSNNDLINYEFEFIKRSFPYDLLKNTLSTVEASYDYILIDCPPSAGYLTVNALIASEAVLVPMQMDVLSLQGLEQMLDTIHEIKETYNPELYVLGVLGVMVDSRRQLTHQVLEHIRNEFGVNIFNNFVRQNVRAAEAPGEGVSVLDYAPKSNSAKDYLSVTNELITMLN